MIWNTSAGSDVVALLQGDLLVITCDLVATVPLHWLTDSHHTKNSTLTLLLVHPSQDDEEPAKKKQLGATGE